MAKYDEKVVSLVGLALRLRQGRRKIEFFEQGQEVDESVSLDGAVVLTPEGRTEGLVFGRDGEILTVWTHDVETDEGVESVAFCEVLSGDSVRARVCDATVKKLRRELLAYGWAVKSDTQEVTACMAHEYQTALSELMGDVDQLEIELAHSLEQIDELRRLIKEQEENP